MTQPNPPASIHTVRQRDKLTPELALAQTSVPVPSQPAERAGRGCSHGAVLQRAHLGQPEPAVLRARQGARAGAGHVGHRCPGRLRVLVLVLVLVQAGRPGLLPNRRISAVSD
ncbi:hypothetical protein X797_007236 [Metarhizium robertsii]|uniref:Thioredoxin n=2 Tax=Metarhizium robertsii TaxID=568076 RepID=A0A0B2XJ67_METRA|nr:Thioredoxin [Metarhizium robertsii ARSEF 23]EXU99769.1 hypothetical protein X797_007236 [Metarhizium robertsii]KHO11527.1 Thioredoxin [Metarhizium robertsii ARSEF 23]